MRWSKRVLLAGLMLLTGCANMMSSSVSEATLERHLQKAVADFDREQLRAGSPLSLTLDSTDITVGPEGRDTVLLEVAGQATFSALASRLPADIELSLEGTPYFDAEEGAIYIRRLQLLDSRVNAPWMPIDLTPVTQMAARLVAQRLETVPVYRLDEAGWGTRALARGMTLRTEPGRLVFAPGR
ncbi:Protein of unknown function [Modicisalibacter ilicicola DSM 19980]|uniref:DUF1439 domain-containing protein n=1 Tax=Modicisalibacter ilicicola DSM 19980 TaxID=1121942 RepID=A0A1M5CK16_9GAMM|nr:DUF1439 domain-containing protein [Halomonas ilicicola]SHF54762.1 Protein of unknown function [Halomonas ilicicola DSM 19980]